MSLSTALDPADGEDHKDDPDNEVGNVLHFRPFCSQQMKRTFPAFILFSELFGGASLRAENKSDAFRFCGEGRIVEHAVLERFIFPHFVYKFAFGIRELLQT